MSKRINNRGVEKSIQKKCFSVLMQCAGLIGIVSSAADAYQFLQQGVQMIISVV